MRKIGMILSLLTVLMLIACSGGAPDASRSLSKTLSEDTRATSYTNEDREPMRMTMFYTGESEHWRGQFIHHSEAGLSFEIYFQMGQGPAIHVEAPQGPITYKIKSATMSLNGEMNLVGNTVKVSPDKLSHPDKDESIRVEVAWNNQVESFVMSNRMQDAILSYEEAMRIAEDKMSRNISTQDYHVVEVSFDPFYLLWKVKAQGNSNVKDYYDVEVNSQTGDIQRYEWEVEGSRQQWSKDNLMDSGGIEAITR